MGPSNALHHQLTALFQVVIVQVLTPHFEAGSQEYSILQWNFIDQGPELVRIVVGSLARKCCQLFLRCRLGPFFLAYFRSILVYPKKNIVIASLAIRAYTVEGAKYSCLLIPTESRVHDDVVRMSVGELFREVVAAE